MRNLFNILMIIYFTLWISACRTNPHLTETSLRGSETEPPKLVPISTGAKLHAILVADTNNQGGIWLKTGQEEIGTQRDLDNLNSLLEEIEETTPLKLEKYIVEGTSFTYPKVKEVLNGLRVDHNDVIFFYYTGHGVNRRGHSWPNLVLGENRASQPELDEIISDIENKHARFFIVLADACNNFDSSSDIGSQKGATPPQFPKEGYKALFLNYRGSIKGTASEAGQTAVGTRDGGKFTLQVLESLNKQAKSAHPEWNQFKDDAEKPIETPVETGIITQKATIEVKIYINDEPTNFAPLDMEMLPNTQLPLGSGMTIKFTNRSDRQGRLIVWDMDSHAKLTRIVPYYENEVVLEAKETRSSVSEAREPIGQSALIAVLAEDARQFEQLKGLMATHMTRQQLLDKLQEFGLTPTELKYEIVGR